MRCTRCDRPAVPQAIGRTPDGRLVFGWCVGCLEDVGCLEVAVAHPVRRHPIASVAEIPLRVASHVHSPVPFDPLAQRRRALGALALVLFLWGMIVLLSGLSLRARRALRPPSRGDIPPTHLIVGGGATASIGLGLWMLTSAAAVLRSRLGLRAVQSFAGLAAVLCVGIALASRARGLDPLLAAFASIALGVVFTARWLEVRRFRRRPA
jgi:hypothetical protein